MKTIEELKYYCNEKEPVGAILLTGEWGCGKTYLIEKELPNTINGDSIVLRLSLFGVSKLEEINIAVKRLWLEAYFNEVGVKKYTDSIGKAVKLISKFNSNSEKISEFTTAEITDFYRMSNRINNKNVVLVFDDLERCNLNTIDVLGVINDFCENKKYHTIIVANQEKIKMRENAIFAIAEFRFVSSDVSNINLNGQKAEAIISRPASETKDEFSYENIKEKLIQRTVKYIPDYKMIVHSVIQNMKYVNYDYETFIKDNEKGIFELFAPESRPHNIRSLKCAINDFYRVYEMLKKIKDEDISNWLYSFVEYVIASKAGIVKDNNENIFADDNMSNFYPEFQSRYMLDNVKKWILNGEWNKENIEHEIELINQCKEAMKPIEIIKTWRIFEIEDNILEEGFEEFVDLLYDGELTLDEYIRFIQNCAWARKDKFEFPLLVDWRKVQFGINKRIEIVKKKLPENQLIHIIISEENKQYFSIDEWNSYMLISDFARGDYFIFLINRKHYIKEVIELKTSAFVNLKNKRYDEFDRDMADATAIAFFQEQNAGKNDFVNSFSKMWKSKLGSSDIDVSKTVDGLLCLKKIVLEKCNEIESNNTKNTYEIIHTKRFIDDIDGLINASNIDTIDKDN